MTTEQKQAVAIFALFKATVEQSNHLNERLKQKEKADFKLWKQQGEKMLAHFEKSNPVEYLEIEKLADSIHNGLSHIIN